MSGGAAANGGVASICVRGGPGGTTVGLDSLEEATGALLLVAREAVEIGWGALAAGTDVDVVAGTVLSPATGIAARVGLLEVAGRGGLTGAAAEIVTTAGAVRAAVAAYRAAEDAVATAVELAQDELMFVAGTLAPQVLVGVLALDALGVDVAALLDRAAFEHPEVADLAGGAEGLVLGLRSNPLTAPLLPTRPGSVGAGGSHADHGTEPDHDTERDYERAVRELADSAAPWGLLADRGRAQVTPEPAARPGARAPLSLRDLAADQRDVGDGEDYGGHVRVIEVPQASGSAWIVEISGTQDWDPRAGDTPFDLTTDVRSMAQEATVLADGVQQALALAQSAAAGSPGVPSTSDGAGAVLLAGHSLGGIAAAGLASSPGFTAEHRVTHVVTMGAPVARMPVPSATQVLSLEHTRDPVPRLDGQRNPDRAGWVTVTRDAHGDGVDRASQTHDVSGYVDTAGLIDASTAPSLVAWRSTSAPFFDGATHGEPVIRDFLVRRVQP